MRSEWQGIGRLDNCCAPYERKYDITPQSVATASEEDFQRARNWQTLQMPNFRKLRDTRGTSGKRQLADQNRLKELERTIFDLQIANRGKDYFTIEFNKNENRSSTNS